MAAFSRLQLAAALLEYDNDPDDPSSLRSAQDSAIFAHIRTRDAPRARTLSGFEHLRETPNLLGVELPISDTVSGRGSMDARRSLAGARNSKGSIDVLRNPFGDDILESEQGAEDEESDGEDLEVDLEAWGMADILGKEKQKSKNQRSGPRMRQPSRTQSEVIPSPQSLVLMDEFGQLNGSRHRPPGTRSKSMSGFGTGNEFLEAIQGAPVASEANFRRRSMGALLDPTGHKTPDFERPLSSARLSQLPPLRSPPRSQFGQPSHTVPFPSPPVPEEETEDVDSFAVRLVSYQSKFDPKSVVHGRTMSTGSLGSQLFLDQGRARTPSLSTAVLDEIPFTLRPSSPSRTSRLDYKIATNERPLSGGMCPIPEAASRERTISIATMGTQGYLDDNPFSLPPPSPTRTSRFDPKVAARTRTMSNPSIGSRLPSEGDRMSTASGQLTDQGPRPPRRYSRMELMRPKVLIMPSPLQGTEEVPATPQLPPGFQLTTVGPPLPPGAQSSGRPFSRAFSSVGGLQVPTTSNVLTPNPRTSMSLSQLTFRNSLIAGGQRDVAYEDIENGLRRAQEDGEQIHQEEDIEEEVAEEQKQAQGKLPGKLYGRSLMDELQARKDQMRAKQRVFTGDQRPSMMSRGQIRRSSTLIDPAALQERPKSQTFGGPPPLSRRGSTNSKPLLDFSNDSAAGLGTTNGRMPNSKSVFGVDQLWERELSRLKQIEAAEREEEEERRRIEEAKAAKKSKGKSSKGKGKGKDMTAAKERSPEPVEALPRPSIVSDLPPMLPAIQKTTGRRPRPPIADYDSDSDSEASENAAKVNAATYNGSADGWQSSGDERQHNKSTKRISSDSEDDVPLASKIAAIRLPQSDSEDEKPLAQILEQKSMLPDVNFDNLLNEKPAPSADDEDDTPLAIKHPRARSIVTQLAAHEDDDDDERPLGLNQVRQQQTQYNMLMQQQMMFQAQLRSSMAFGAPSMLSGLPPFMLSQTGFGAAPAVPMYDTGKYHSVDKWRHNVAAE